MQELHSRGRLGVHVCHDPWTENLSARMDDIRIIGNRREDGVTDIQQRLHQLNPTKYPPAKHPVFNVD